MINKDLNIGKNHFMLQRRLRDKKLFNQPRLNFEKTQNFSSQNKFFQKLRLYFKEYCQNCTLHGFMYVGENNKTIFERIWWMLIIIISTVLCSFMIVKAWNKWNMNPVLISISEKPTTIWQIPHPAITICPQTKFNKTKFDFLNLFDEYALYKVKNEPKKDYTKFLDATLLCNFLNIYDGETTTNESVIDFFHEISFTWTEFIYDCKWGTSSNCDEFRHSLTEEGICFTLNSLDYTELFRKEFQDERYLNNGRHSDWSLHFGYNNLSNQFSYPKSPNFAGFSKGVVISLLGKIKDLEYYCRGLVQGYKIFFHNPEEVPGLTRFYVRTGIDEEVKIAIHPEVTTTSEDLVDYPPSIRQCYFPNEKYLRFYQIYTQVNCEFECLTNYTLKYCGCVAFYMPRKYGTPICATGKRRCLENAKKNLINEVIEKEIVQSNLPVELKKSTKSCECLPACTSLNYNSEVFRSSIDEEKNGEIPNLETGEHETRIVIYYKDTEFTFYKRSKLYGLIDFLANCGGFLGLFIGFSFMSLLEFVYYLTLRVWCNIKRNRKFTM